MQSSDLTVTCRGCGSALTLDGRAPLVPGFRPFVAVHRACAGGDEPDREMRTAFARSA
ncbi:MAG: hypothetical protein JWN77_1143 [Frankiales bacterium]|jgi:hypothetical protein|nr:hypothetical protein [Frankiales bacterium]